MKVFELMQALSEMPAGAEVKFERMTTMEEFIKSDIDTNDENVAYFFSASVAEVEKTNSSLVKLYGG